jgi:hypothetical protein
MHAPAYARAVHPEHGQAVVFTPGELLPAWVSDSLTAGGELVAADDGTLDLVPAGSKTPRARRHERSAD